MEWHFVAKFANSLFGDKVRPREIEILVTFRMFLKIKSLVPA
jgi:hypothetical protein